MGACSEQQRVACALGGIYTALAIDKVLPVLHCGPGCQSQAGAILGGCNGGQNAYPYQETILPCTDFGESDVIFGAKERLRKIIAQALDNYKADIIVAVGGCTASIIGDDIEEVVGNFLGSRIPVLYAEIPGFKGNNLYGHSKILKAIIGQYLEPSPNINSRQVNVWGIVPYYDTMWEGTLEEIEKLMISVGLKPNIIYGHGRGIENLKKIPQAEFNLVLSPWVDLDIVEELKERFNTPFFHYPTVPIGPTETSKFLRELADYASLEKKVVEAYIKENEDRYYYYINRSLSWIYHCRPLTKKYVTISSASAALSTTRFLINDLGFIPEKVYIVEDVPKEYQERVRSYFEDVELDDKIDLIFTDDAGIAAEELKDKELRGNTVLLGSAWDDALAQNFKIPFIPISAPYGDVIIGNKNYFGYTGGISLFADYYTAVANKTGLGVTV